MHWNAWVWQSKRSLLRLSSAGTSLVVQWLRLHTSTAAGVGSFPGQGTKIPHAAWAWPKGKKKTIKYCWVWNIYVIKDLELVSVEEIVKNECLKCGQ